MPFNVPPHTNIIYRAFDLYSASVSPNYRNSYVLARMGNDQFGYFPTEQFALTSSNTFVGDQIISGSLTITGQVSSSIWHVIEFASGNIMMTGSIEHLTTLGFDTGSTRIVRAGEMTWNTTDKTFNVGMGYMDGVDPVTNQLGQELYYPPVVNKDSVDLKAGTFVMINPAGAAQGNRISIIRADATPNKYPSDYFMGILTMDIPINQEGLATWFGYVRNVSRTELEAAGQKDPAETWLEGDILFPDPTRLGGLTRVQPVKPASQTTVCAITAVNGKNVTFMVRPTLGRRLDSLYDVSVTGQVTGSILWMTGSVYHASNTNFKLNESTAILAKVSSSYNFADDTTAAAGGVPLGGLYHTSGSIKIRLV